LSPQNGTGACTATGTGVLGKTCNTDGAIGYGDLRAWSALTAGTFLASLQTAASAGGPPAFVGPGTVGGLSNCNITGVASLPG
ncbi:hypothetical protein, partial [Salmonella enterica]|uniref:hypothetical protein n=1 Tax=Salmonella enterica TaxID=28901 RepID=UPI003CF19ADE